MATDTAHMEALPILAAAPNCFASCAISRPCLLDQTTCQVNMMKAKPKTITFNQSCPAPSAALLISLIKPATSIEPNKPTITPKTIARLRPAKPRVAAAIMPMNKAASSVSRKTIKPVANITEYFQKDQRQSQRQRFDLTQPNRLSICELDAGLLCNQITLRRCQIKLTEEVIFTRS